MKRLFCSLLLLFTPACAMHPTTTDPYTLPTTKDEFESFLQRNNIEKHFAPVIKTILRSQYLYNNNNELIKKWLIQTMQYYFKTGNLPTKPRKKLLRYYRGHSSTITTIIEQLADQASKCDDPSYLRTPSFEFSDIDDKEKNITLDA